MGAAQKISVDEILSRLEDLPTLPTIVQELSQVINDPMSSTAEIEKMMANDQSLTTKVLKLVNSAYYAIPGGVNNLGRAIAYLGYDTVFQLVLSASIFQALKTQKTALFNIAEFWKHSLGVGIAAESIGKATNHPMPSDLFTCGLIHDMGKVALLKVAEDQFLTIVAHAKKGGLSFNEAEIELDYSHHTTIGQRLALRWRLPTQLHSVVKYHHQKDPNLRGGLSADLNRAVDIVYLANLLTHAVKFGNSGHNKVLSAPGEVLDRLMLDPKSDLLNLIKEIKIGLNRAADFLLVLGD
jgi:HD-like signal output (HDOD) protein